MDKKDREAEFLNSCSKELIIFGLLLLFFVSLCLLLCNSCTSIERLNDYMGWKDDNVVEEAIEDVLEKETGIKLDLTPRSPEVPVKDK